MQTQTSFNSSTNTKNARELEEQAFQFSQRGEWASGAAIGNLMAQALAYPEMLSLAAGFVDNATLPCDIVANAMSRLASDQTRLRRALQYDATAGNLDLRDAIATFSHRNEPASRPDVEQVVLTAGSNQMLHLVAEAILNPGDIVLCASPTYFVFLGTIRGVGAKAVGVSADQEGMCIEDLKSQLEALEQTGLASKVKAIYCVTEFDNPAGSTLSLARRQELLNVVERWRHKHGEQLLLLSDNAYRELRYEGKDLPSLLSLSGSAKDFVVELGTFSKSFSPGIRVGWGTMPRVMIDRLLDMKSNVDFGSPHFSQMLVLESMQSGDMESHLPRILESYTSKRDAMLGALQESLGSVEGVTWRMPGGGLYVWLTLPNQIDTSEHSLLWKASIDEGVLYVPGHHCYPTFDNRGEPTQVPRNAIRLSFGVQNEVGIRLGIRKLAQAIRATLAN